MYVSCWVSCLNHLCCTTGRVDPGTTQEDTNNLCPMEFKPHNPPILWTEVGVKYPPVLPCFHSSLLALSGGVVCFRLVGRPLPISRGKHPIFRHTSLQWFFLITAWTPPFPTWSSLHPDTSPSKRTQISRYTQKTGIAAATGAMRY